MSSTSFASDTTGDYYAARFFDRRSGPVIVQPPAANAGTSGIAQRIMVSAWLDIYVKPDPRTDYGMYIDCVLIPSTIRQKSITSLRGRGTVTYYLDNSNRYTFIRPRQIELGQRQPGTLNYKSVSLSFPYKEAVDLLGVVLGDACKRHGYELIYLPHGEFVGGIRRRLEPVPAVRSEPA